MHTFSFDKQFLPGRSETFVFSCSCGRALIDPHSCVKDPNPSRQSRNQNWREKNLDHVVWMGFIRVLFSLKFRPFPWKERRQSSSSEFSARKSLRKTNLLFTLAEVLSTPNRRSKRVTFLNEKLIRKTLCEVAHFCTGFAHFCTSLWVPCCQDCLRRSLQQSANRKRFSATPP